MPVVWLWMFIVGLGVGPTFSVFTIVIQNAVPFRQLGVATSNLTFFRQIGGTIALAFVGTIFADVVPGAARAADARRRRAAAGPRRVRPGDGPGAFDFNQLTGVGDLGPDHRRRRCHRPRTPFIDQPWSRASTRRSASPPPRPSGSASSARSSRPSRRSRSRRSRSAPPTTRRSRPRRRPRARPRSTAGVPGARAPAGADGRLTPSSTALLHPPVPMVPSGPCVGASIPATCR